MDLFLKDKVAVVAAASKGLGKAAALEFAREGARVAICSRNADEINNTANEIASATGSEVLGIKCDVSDKDEIKSFIARVIDTFSTVDILVNNAGGPPAGNFGDFDIDEWQKAVELNLFSAINLSNEALPYMKKQNWGRIVNITSVSVKQPIDGLILSNTVRAGVIGLAKSMSNELAPFNILVNNVCPGRIYTDRIKELATVTAEKENKSFEQVISDMGQTVPLGRIGKPEELANLIVFLASERASYITGATILVDGGLAKSIM